MTSPASSTSASSGLEGFRAQLDLLTMVEKSGSEVIPVGGGKGKILCPFHAEDTPSCHLYPATSSFYCFGCQESGDLFKLVMALRDGGFGEALDWLSEVSGVPRPQRSPQAEAAAAALRGLRRALTESREEQTSLPFGLSVEQAERLGLGYAADLSTVVADLSRPLLSPTEQGDWEGHWTLELQSRGGPVGFGAFLENDAEGNPLAGSFRLAAATRGPAFVGLAAAREGMSRAQAAVVCSDPVQLLRLVSAGLSGALALVRPLDPEAAALLVALQPRVVLLVPDGEEPGRLLPAALTILRLGGKPHLAAPGPEITPVPLFLFLIRQVARLGAEERRRLLTEFLGAVPSPSSRLLYEAELTQLGLLSEPASGDEEEDPDLGWNAAEHEETAEE